MGFTLLEVMIAVLVLGTVFGALLQLMNGHLARLADARQELAEAGLAEARLREIWTVAESGTLPKAGRSSGTFDPPYDYVQWELVVAEAQIPLPEELEADAAASSLFGRRIAPGAREEKRPEALSLIQLQFTVFQDASAEPNSLMPYRLYLVKQPKKRKFRELKLRREEERAAQKESEPQGGRR